MRPSFAEQLEGIARILEEVVAPEVADPYPSDVLAGAVGTLRVLADAHDRLPGFLEWDTAATTSLLARAGVVVDPGRADDDADARHRRARAALEAAVPRLAEDADLRGELLALFAERAQRFPFAFTPGGHRAGPAR